MEDRKLYHLVNEEFVHDGMPSVHIPTYEELSAHIAILLNVGFFDDPIAESVPAWSGIGTGKRSDAVQASVFDMIHAEILGEHNAEKAKVRNRRKADRKHPENKAERKKEKQNRMHRLYGLAYEDTKYGKTVYFWDKKEGQKKFPEYEAEIFRNLKERSAEKIARADWERDLADWDYDIAYEEFNAEICREDICELNMEIQSLEYQLSDVDILRNRLENLRKERDVTEKYLRNSEEFLRKYMWVKEML